MDLTKKEEDIIQAIRDTRTASTTISTNCFTESTFMLRFLQLENLSTYQTSVNYKLEKRIEDLEKIVRNAEVNFQKAYT